MAQTVNHIEDIILSILINYKEIFVLMHSGIVNGYQLLCDAHNVLEPHSHRGTADIFPILFVILFTTFSFCSFVTLDISIFVGFL